MVINTNFSVIDGYSFRLLIHESARNHESAPPNYANEIDCRSVTTDDYANELCGGGGGRGGGKGERPNSNK